MSTVWLGCIVEGVGEEARIARPHPPYCCADRPGFVRRGSARPIASIERDWDPQFGDLQNGLDTVIGEIQQPAGILAHSTPTTIARPSWGCSCWPSCIRSAAIFLWAWCWPNGNTRHGSWRQRNRFAVGEGFQPTAMRLPIRKPSVMRRAGCGAYACRQKVHRTHGPTGSDRLVRYRFRIPRIRLVQQVPPRNRTIASGADASGPCRPTAPRSVFRNDVTAFAPMTAPWQLGQPPYPLETIANERAPRTPRTMRATSRR